MRSSPSIEGGTEAPLISVAGRIDAPLSEFASALSEYLDSLRHRNKKTDSIRTFRCVIEAAARECGWTSLHHFTFDAATKYLGSRRDAGTWKNATYNHNLAILRCFGEWLEASKRLPDNPLAAARGADDDSPGGARAATLDEARRLVLAAWIQEQSDRRSRGTRALYWTCLFAAGCRINEPARWRWKNLRLDDEVPHIAWTPDVSKTRIACDTALTIELTILLRSHREALGSAAIKPDKPMFPIVPSPCMFRADANRARIEHFDHRERRFSAHSARKFFSTQATAAGVPEKMVDFLMRHAGRVEHRYFDPSLIEQAQATALMSPIWPPQAHAQSDLAQVSRISMGKSVDAERDLDDDAPDVQDQLTSQFNSSSPPRPCGIPERHSGAVRPGGDAEYNPERAGRPTKVRSTRKSQSGNGHFLTEHGVDPTDVADLLEVVARLLLQGATDGERERGGQA